MLTKYRLINVPEDGVDHLIPSFGKVSITEDALTDELAEKLIEYGVTQYFEKLENVEPENKTEDGEGKERPSKKRANTSTEAGEPAA